MKSSKDIKIWILVGSSKTGWWYDQMLFVRSKWLLFRETVSNHGWYNSTRLQQHKKETRLRYQGSAGRGIDDLTKCCFADPPLIHETNRHQGGNALCSESSFWHQLSSHSWFWDDHSTVCTHPFVLIFGYKYIQGSISKRVKTLVSRKQGRELERSDISSKICLHISHFWPWQYLGLIEEFLPRDCYKWRLIFLRLDYWNFPDVLEIW